MTFALESPVLRGDTPITNYPAGTYKLNGYTQVASKMCTSGIKDGVSKPLLMPQDGVQYSPINFEAIVYSLVALRNYW